MWEEYKPSRRRIAPPLPRSAASYSASTLALYSAVKPDVRMELVELIGEGDAVVGRFTCSATHLGEWLGQAPTGRRFEQVDEVSIFRFHEGRIAQVWSLEDNLGRLRQLGLTDETG
jgi:predicted ester cyclase